MLRELLLRDVVSHRRALIGSAVSLMLILATWVLATRGDAIKNADAAGMLGGGLFLVSLIPISLHIREIMQGTLGDLLALPVARWDIVRLRFIEGLLACSLYLALYLLVCAAAFRPSPANLAKILGNFEVRCVVALALSYPMPFVLQGSRKCMAWAFIPPAICYTLFLLLCVKLGAHRAGELVSALIHRLEAIHGDGLGAALLDCGILLLILLASYRLSLWAIEKAEV